MSGYIERAITVIITAGPKSDNNPNPITFGPNNQNTLTLAGIVYPQRSNGVGKTLS